MNISFLQDDPIDTVIINTADGRPLYEVHTPSKLTNRITSIRRVEPGVVAGQGQIIAEVHWHTWSSSKISFLGSTMRLDEFLRQDSFWSQSKTIIGSDRRLYKWKHESNKFKLIDSQTNAVVAESHRSKMGVFSTPRKMNVDILPQGMQSLDVIVVSFIIMEEKQRQQQTAAIAASSASA